ncbi:hypothetical protein Q9233_005880 [Columba guinea]|nr:hypothetical protein Q9233_005880 [Columba guinea]
MESALTMLHPPLPPVVRTYLLMLEWYARVEHGKHEMNLEMCQCDMAWVDWFDVKLAPYGEACCCVTTSVTRTTGACTAQLAGGAEGCLLSCTVFCRSEMSWHPQYRSSKFRHVYGKPASKEKCYDCVPITHNVHDNHFCAVNPPLHCSGD